MNQYKSHSNINTDLVDMCTNKTSCLMIGFQESKEMGRYRDKNRSNIETLTQGMDTNRNFWIEKSLELQKSVVKDMCRYMIHSNKGVLMGHKDIRRISN